MANFSAADVKRLRELTAAGMMDCKRALEEADGDFDAAVEILRIKGAKDVGKRAARTTANGMVAARIDDSLGVLVELNCETDFVAKGVRFQALGAALVDAVAVSGAADLESLLAADAGGRPVSDLVAEESAALGEKIEIGRIARFDGANIGGYLHKTDPDLPPQIGVLVQLDSANPEVAKDIAQHVAAFNPLYLTRDDVPAETVESERRIAEATAREEGKPEQAISKIVEGRVSGYFKDTVLVEQPFAKEPKKSVRQVLADAGVGVTRFARFKVGQS